MDSLVLNGINLELTKMGTKIIFDYDAPVSLSKYIKGSSLFVEFPGDIRSVPNSILAIPFVGAMLSVTMLLDIEIQVPELDELFYHSLEEIEAVFQHMYPKAGIHCRVLADKLCPSSTYPVPTANGCSLFFTGGVDATSALAELADKKPLLINIWGGDLRLTDDASHTELENYLDTLAAQLGLEYCFVKTNAREMFKENDLGYLCEKLIGHQKNHGWWASIAHILSMTTTIAPWLWVKGISTHYIGSSYDGQIKTLDANNDDMIAAVKMHACTFSMVDYATDRNKKIQKIIEFRNKHSLSIRLKVCWQRTAGKNCSCCEKCYRTILGIISHRGNPNDYGFDVDQHTVFHIKSFLESHTVNIGFWKTIQNTFLEERSFWRNYPEISWILDIKLNSVLVYLKKIYRFFIKA